MGRAKPQSPSDVVLSVKNAQPLSLSPRGKSFTCRPQQFGARFGVPVSLSRGSGHAPGRFEKERLRRGGVALCAADSPDSLQSRDTPAPKETPI